ncbi:hypothetical protein GCK72_005832 [Caenorhabditis remanei]|uniref:CRE-CSC-1 protein n=2 Tax=Caenorhabditis remanei TaxID=31234 RepID=E3M422_CAERE|nr:hypothetical protein GCK72_005832 [Caenorhabditis remanei]EFO91626.1 CRE-CSC-1 protein [Caenorhabditis remanei]KAF1765879.1 hypothetical protein GCK72_005832 [Caenorhabditis remanei]
MPPRKIKKDPEVTKIVDAIEEPLRELIDDLKRKLYKAAKDTARAETTRILSKIPKEYHDMPINEFLQSSPAGLLEALKGLEIQEDSDTEVESEQRGTENIENQDEMEMDDAAHETSIPIAHSGQNSGRNTATEPHRNEIITPAGHVFPIPVLHPHKPFRNPHAHEEIAFSVNGSPLVLAANSTNKKKPVRSTTKKGIAESGLLVPKDEDLGTSV